MTYVIDVLFIYFDDLTLVNPFNADVGKIKNYSVNISFEVIEIKNIFLELDSDDSI